MLSIGDFARLAGVSVRMLRHYDQLGLLTPHRVDESSGYRYYAAGQLPRVNQLVALKELGFSLEEVGVILDDVPAPKLAEMLRIRQAELHRRIGADQLRLRQVEARLSSIDHTPTERTFTETPLPELRLVQLSTRIEDTSRIEAEIGPLFDRVGEAVRRSGAIRTGPGVAHYTVDGDALVAAAAEQVDGPGLPDGLAATTLAARPRALTTQFVAADLLTIQSAWQGLVTEVERRGLRARGTAREIYWETPFDGPGQRWVVDLQQPCA